MTRLDGIGGHRQEEDLCNVLNVIHRLTMFTTVSIVSVQMFLGWTNQPPTTTQPALIATRQYIIVILGLPQKPSNTAGSWLPFRGRQAGRRPSIYGKAEEYVIPTIIIIKCITPTTEIPVPAFFICSGTWTILSWQQIVAPSTMIHTFACTHSLCLPFNSQPL